MRLKGILIGVWLTLPALLTPSPSLFGLIDPHTDFNGYVRNVGLAFSLGIDERPTVRPAAG